MSADLATPKQVIVTTPPSEIAVPTTAALGREQQEEQPIDETIRLIARSLGRQAARRHLARGWSLMEVAILLVVGALIVAATLYLKTPPGRFP